MTDNMHPQIPMPALPPRPDDTGAATPQPASPQPTPTYPDTANVTPQPEYPGLSAATPQAQQPYPGYPTYPEQPAQPYGQPPSSAYTSPTASGTSTPPPYGGVDVPPSTPADGTPPPNGYGPQPIPVTVVQQAPAYKLKTNRGLLKYILLGLITFGIYDIVVMYDVTESTNMVATPHDGRKSTNYLLMFFLFGWLSLGIAWLVWYSNLSDRIGNELQRRGMPREVSMADFWLWGILGSLIIVGPFIYLHKLLKATNLMCEDYNARG